MPTYQYACTDTDCGNRFELVQKFTDPAADECPVCGSPVRKVFSSVGVVFKGSGFYRNDSRESADKTSKSGRAEDSAGSDGSAKESSKSGDGSGASDAKSGSSDGAAKSGTKDGASAGTSAASGSSGSGSGSSGSSSGSGRSSTTSAASA